MLAKSQRDVARESHKIAADRVKTTTAVAHASKEYMEKARLVDHENRIQATLELKANTDAASALGIAAVRFESAEALRPALRSLLGLSKL